jgi:beta-glucosidase
MSKYRVVATTLAGSLCALAVAGSSQIQGAAGSTQLAADATPTPIYKDPSYSFSERAADLVSRMTLAEKASQTDSNISPAIPRLGVPSYGWWNEALHGVAELSQVNNANAGFLTNTTSYPINQSLAASWDPSLEYQIASNISDEAREVMPGNSEELDFYSPTMNLERDPRWGRNDESYGEDPLLERALVDQFVDGMEGKDSGGHLLGSGGGFNKTITTLKHFTANNSEVNRRTGSSDMDARTLLEYDTKPFGQVVQDAHPGSIMSSYNEVNGTPSPADPYLMQTLARETWGFDGYFTSDCDAVYEITAGHNWTPPGWTRPINNLERNGYAMASGEDLDCNTGYHDNYNYLDALPTDTRQGIRTATDTFNVNDLDMSAVRLFTARMKTGEFDDPLTVPWVTQARSRVPSWTNSDANNAVTETPARLALARRAADESIVLLKNASTTRKDGTTGKLLPLHVPSSGAFKVAVIGYFANPTRMYLGGYSSLQGTAGTANEVNGYQGIKAAVTAIDPDATVDYYKGFTGTGTQASQLTTVDPAAVAAAANYDAVIVYAGTDSSTSTEDRDRSTLQLPGAQNSLIQQVAAANPNTIVYMETVGPIDVSPFESGVPALVYSSYNGMRKGEALADVLLGGADPSGRLPSTWYANDAQMPPVTDYAIRPNGTNLGRTYQYFIGQTRYPFGYGLSYTSFKYSNLQLSSHNLTADDTLNATVTVTNTGAMAGADTVQLYVNQPNAPAALQRPAKRLEGFQRVTLDPGASTTVTIPVKIPELAYWDDAAHKWAVDDGTYGIQLSESAADSDVQAQDTINVTGAITPKPNAVTAEPVVAGSDPNRDIQQRVFFTAGQAIDPQLTVAMNDATLYGYQVKGSSTGFPSGMSFSYSSNRPGVVAVDAAGRIRTVADGVATVTANVTYGGVTRSTSFVVDVVSQLSNITVNGQPLAALNPGRAFAPDTYTYDVVLPAGSAAPAVAATSADPSASVAVTQAPGVPGSATIVSTGADGTAYTYTVNFANPVQSDEFNGSAPGPQWTWVRNDPTAENESNGSLNITAQPGDLNAATNTAKNLLLQPALGDWAVETKMTLSVTPHTANQQAGLIAYQDDDNYLKLDWEFSGTTAQLVETYEDFSFIPNAPATTALPTVLKTVPTASLLSGNNASLWLKMIKSGPRYQTYYSTDGATWTPFYEVGGSLTNVKVGLFSYNRAGTSTDLTTAFDYFRAGNTAVATGGVGGTVPATLALSLGPPASFGPFTPGVARDYTASTTANVISTAGDATLSVADPDTNAPGHLVNGAYSLPSPLQAAASSPAGAGGAFAPVGGTANPLTLLRYGAPVSNDPVTISFLQHIGATDALRTGSYGKTLTFTLSTDQP